MKSKTRLFFIALFSSLSIIIQFSCSQFDSERFDRALEKLKTYQFGNSRAALSEIETLVMQTTNDRDQRMIASRLAEILESDISFAAKQFICQQLRVIGLDEQIPVLTNLLLTKEYTDIAVFALESNPSRKVDEALWKILPDLDGQEKIAVINTLGERRNRESVEVMAPLLSDDDPLIAEAAALALGKIGTVPASENIKKAMTEAKQEWKNRLAISYLMCANQIAESGDKDIAVQIYNELSDQDFDTRMRMKAQYGLVKIGQADAIQFVTMVGRSQDDVAHRLAFQTVVTIPGEEFTLKICRLLSGLPAQSQILFLKALSEREDPAALSSVSLLVDHKDKGVRLAAINAISALGNESSIPLLMQKIVGKDADEKGEAQIALYRLKGDTIDELVIQLTDDKDPLIREEAVMALLARNVVQSTPKLILLLGDPDENIRGESWNALAELGSEKDLSPMISAWIQLKNSEEINIAEEAVVKVIGRSQSTHLSTPEIVTAVRKMENKDIKISLIHALGRIGDLSTLPKLRELLKSSDPDIKTETIRALSWWPSGEPLQDLRNVVTSTTDEKDKILAIRGYIQLIGVASRSGNDQTHSLYDDAMALTWRNEEKKMVLAGYSKVYTMDALKAIEPYLSDIELRNEASAAVIKICDELVEDISDENDRNKMIELLKLIGEESDVEALKEEASDILSRMED